MRHRRKRVREETGLVTIEMVRTIKRLLPALEDTPNLSVAYAVSKAIIEHHAKNKRLDEVK